MHNPYEAPQTESLPAQPKSSDGWAYGAWFCFGGCCALCFTSWLEGYSVIPTAIGTCMSAIGAAVSTIKRPS
jgi:hypothetical protein